MKCGDLAALLAPVETDAFLAEFWGVEPLLAQGRDADRYGDLPDIDAFELLLASLPSPEAGWFSFVKDRATRPPSHAITRDGTLDMAEVYRALDAKFSLLLTKLHRRHVGVRRLCQALDADLADHGVVLKRTVGANGYFTPPDAQGFAPHFDDHDVFILQLAGAKSWSLYGPVEPSPAGPMRSALGPAELGPERKAELMAGDLLYLPRGYVHAARTGPSSSLHLTLSVHPATWSDVFAEVVEETAVLRQNLPLGFCRQGTPRGADVSQFRKMWEQTAPSIPAAMVEVFGRATSEGDPPPRGVLSKLGQEVKVGLRTRLAPSADLHLRAELSDERAVLHLPGTALRADQSAAPLFQRMCEGEPFRLADLNSPDGALLAALAEELVRQGYLVSLADPDIPAVAPLAQSPRPESDSVSASAAHAPPTAVQGTPTTT